MVNWWFVVVWIPRIPLCNGLLRVSLESQPPTQTKKLAEVIGKRCFLLTVSFLGGNPTSKGDLQTKSYMASLWYCFIFILTLYEATKKNGIFVPKIGIFVPSILGPEKL